MADEHNSQPLRLELAHDREEVLDFVGVQAGRRLVEHQNAGFDMKRAGNGHHLLDRDRVAVQRPPDIHLDVQLFQRCRGANMDLPPVDARELLRLAAKKYVFRHGQEWNQVDLLINRADPEALCFGGRMRINGTTFEQDCTAIATINAGEHLDQRAFAGAVLAHQGVDFASAQREIHTIKGAHAGKSLSEAADGQQRSVPGRPEGRPGRPEGRRSHGAVRMTKHG